MVLERGVVDHVDDGRDHVRRVARDPVEKRLQPAFSITGKPTGRRRGKEMHERDKHSDQRKNPELEKQMSFNSIKKGRSPIVSLPKAVAVNDVKFNSS